MLVCSLKIVCMAEIVEPKRRAPNFSGELVGWHHHGEGNMCDPRCWHHHGEGDMCDPRC